MNDVRIFEIPIYGISKEVFNEKWERHISKTVDTWVKMGWDREKALNEYESLLFPRTVWKYSQIIGYLTIDISASDIFFDIYAPMGEQYRYNTSRKLYIHCWSVIGQHFRIEDTMSNDDILKEIHWWIAETRKDCLKKWYLDTSTFDNVSPFVDYRGIIENIKLNKHNGL